MDFALQLSGKGISAVQLPKLLIAAFSMECVMHTGLKQVT